MQSTVFVYNNNIKNPGFINEKLTKDDAEKIATFLNIPKDKSNSIPLDLPTFCDKNENIMIETGYGISFNNDNIGIKESLEYILIKLGYKIKINYMTKYVFRFKNNKIIANDIDTSTGESFRYNYSLSLEQNQKNLEEILFSNIEEKIKKHLSDNDLDYLCKKECDFKKLFSPELNVEQYKLK